jgi:hypothetical protein
MSVRWPVRLIRIGQVSIRVTVVMAKPGHGEGQAILIAAFGDEVEIAARLEVKKQNRVTLAGLGSAARADGLLQPRLHFASDTRSQTTAARRTGAARPLTEVNVSP